MTASVRSPEDVINVALTRIGYKNRIVNIYEGSEAARAALRIYAQTRDELLRAVDYGFSERTVTLELLKQAPAGGYFPPNVWSTTFPPLPWIFEYAYPDDCLKVRAVKPTPIFIPVFDPQSNVFNIANDSALNPPAKVLLCNVPAAILTYTGQVVDPTTWESDFVEELSAALGRRLAPVLAGLDQARMEIADESSARTIADNEQG